MKQKKLFKLSLLLARVTLKPSRLALCKIAWTNKGLVFRCVVLKEFIALK